MHGFRSKGPSDYVWDHYEPSVPMSTYLVAFVVSDFGYITAQDVEKNNVTFRYLGSLQNIVKIMHA